MNLTTAGIKLDIDTKERIKEAAASLDRTPHWFMRTAVLYWLEKVEAGLGVEDMLGDKDLETDTIRNSVYSRSSVNET
ncbi:hypothetical protein IAE39_000624 [Pseudomonas sp. S37]|uniref:ribbon-helix-helix protein, CopG family n=1 Tax=Pseudomonas sp. S37 TaxID=2767449 RepID=UPI0019137954|nr:ribbon-helix-helix protein, CopG family [Pseudomonas sp. S37]MBK4992450.1 hypothetical protein [Pseudomonas sp. S37]